VIVCKFGGTSVANAQQLQRVRDIVFSDPRRHIVVVSAPGKRSDGDTKVTDMLIACAKDALKGADVTKHVDALAERYASIARDLKMSLDVIAEIRADLLDRLNGPKVNEHRFMDAVKAAGEDYSAQLTAAYFNSCGRPARYVDPRQAGLLLSEEYGQARILDVSYKNLAKLKDSKELVVFPGFFGYTPAGHLVTFSRGGSDITGAILASAVEAEAYENWTDVDGIFVADPKLIHHPMVIKEITYQELRELAYAGFRVFHDEAMAPVVRTGTPVNIRNTNNPSAPGTMVLPTRQARRGAVIGVACSAGFMCIHVFKYLMNREKGFGRRLLQIVEEANCSFEHAPTGVDSMSVVLSQDQLDPDAAAKVKERILRELDADSVEFDRDITMVSVVGMGMKHTLGIAARAAGALASASVNIELINQGPSEISMVFGVKQTDGPSAIRALYREFFEKPS